MMSNTVLTGLIKIIELCGRTPKLINELKHYIKSSMTCSQFYHGARGVSSGCGVGGWRNGGGGGGGGGRERTGDNFLYMA